MTFMIWTSAIYLIACVSITIWVARNLRLHGKVYVTNGKDENPGLVDAISHLLIVGFYLINFGLISLALKYGGNVENTQAAIELLSTKIGGVLLGLGCMHFVILMIFAGMRKNNQDIFEPETASRHSSRFAEHRPSAL